MYGGFEDEVDDVEVFKGELPVLAQAQSVLIKMESVIEALGPRVLSALDQKFNGSLTLVRYPDENDLLF